VSVVSRRGDSDLRDVAAGHSDDPVVRAAANWRHQGWDAGAHFMAALSIVAVEEEIRAASEQILAPHGLTNARHEALAVLFFSRRGEMPMGALGRQLMLHPTSVTSTVDALEGRGLVERVPHPEDRRATLARITPTGRRVMVETCQRIADQRSGIGVLTDDEAMTLFELLRKVRGRSAGLPIEGLRVDQRPVDELPVDARDG
jgi:DNA-binding MarR family transcriptional regulator